MVFPELGNDLWSRRSLSKITTCLGKPIEVQRLESNAFQFSETIWIIAIDRRGEMRERSIRVEYPCKPPYCCNCGGFGHVNYKERTWTVVVASGVPAIRTLPVPIISFLTSMPNKESENSNLLPNQSNAEGDSEWQKVRDKSSLRNKYRRSASEIP